MRQQHVDTGLESTVHIGFGRIECAGHAGNLGGRVAITKFVSVGSLAAAIGLPIAACAVFPYSSLGLKFCMAMIGITVVWAHRANIKKLMTGKESKLSFTKRVTEPDDK